MAEANLDSIRLITVQISCSNWDIIPKGGVFRLLSPETREEALARQDRNANTGPGAGQSITKESVNGTSLAILPEDLLAAGYLLVDATQQSRVDLRPNKPSYLTTRSVFCQERHAKISTFPDFSPDAAMSALRTILSEAFWRVRASFNPLFEKGEKVGGSGTISINLEAREPRFQGNAEHSPVTRWLKDADGECIGDRPVPIRPNWLFRLGGENNWFYFERPTNEI